MDCYLQSLCLSLSLLWDSRGLTDVPEVPLGQSCPLLDELLAVHSLISIFSIHTPPPRLAPHMRHPKCANTTPPTPTIYTHRLTCTSRQQRTVRRLQIICIMHCSAPYLAHYVNACVVLYATKCRKSAYCSLILQSSAVQSTYSLKIHVHITKRDYFVCTQTNEFGQCPTS